jgi:putative peptidoglycan lipid II flippase
MSLARSSMIIGSLTLLSRVFGFVRDMMIATTLGASIYTDAFFVAFKLPNFLRRLFAEGAFNSAFLPMFAGMLKTQGKEESMRFASEAYSWLFFTLTIITVLAIIFMPHLMFILAPGFSKDPVKLALTIALTRITFPYILFISLVCLQGGILNSIDKFAAVAATPILMNICFIIGLPLFSPFTPSAAHAFAWGVVLAGVVQFGWLYYFCHKANMSPKLHIPKMTSNVRRLLQLIAPAALGAGVAQINLMIDLMIASDIHQGVSYLYYADRIYELPLGVIGIAVATALLPTLSKHIRAGEHQAAVKDTNNAIMLVMLFGMPCATALTLIAEPVIGVVFEHGAFSTHDTALTFPALVAFSCGLPAFLLVKIFASNFFAAQDTKTPVRIAIVCVLVNLMFNLLLKEQFAHVGMAMATTISGWLNASCLGYMLYRNKQFVPDYTLGSFLSKMIVACAAMHATLAIALHLLNSWIASGATLRTIALVILVSAGGATYFATLFATKAITKRGIKELIRPKGRKASPIPE